MLKEINLQLNMAPGEIPESSKYLIGVDLIGDLEQHSLEDQQYWLFAIKAARAAGAQLLCMHHRTPTSTPTTSPTDGLQLNGDRWTWMAPSFQSLHLHQAFYGVIRPL